MKKPRITGHQLQIMFGIRKFEDDVKGSPFGPFCPKSWTNAKGVRVWQFRNPKHTNVLGDPWDCQTGESLVKKGLIEKSFSITHDGGYDAPDGHYRYALGKEITFYKLTELGRSYLN